MNVLLSFRYLNSLDEIYDRIYVSEVGESDEINNIISEVNDVKRKMFSIIPEDVDFIEMLKELAYNDGFRNITKFTLIDIVNDNLNAFNKRKTYDEYVWLDEVCTIIVDRGQAIIMDDKSEYGDLDATKHIVQEAVQLIKDNDPNFDLNRYCDVYFVMYIDIFNRYDPLYIYDNKKC